MTSKNSYSDFTSLGTLMREDLKRRLWTIALSILGCIFALPVFSALCTNIWMERYNNMWGVTIQDIQLSYYADVISCGNIPVMLLIVGLALVNGVQGMLYLHSRVKSDMYGSLPIRRTRLFTACYLNGILIFAVPYIIAHILTIVFVKPRFPSFVTPDMVKYSVISVCIIIVFYTAIYSLVVLASVLTGHTVIAIMAAAVLNGIGLWYYTLHYFFQQEFFVTWYQGFYESFEHRLMLTSPVCALIPIRSSVYRLMQQKLFGIGGDTLLYTGIYLILSVILYILCRGLIVIRPAEAAGKALAFPKTKPFIKVILLVPISLTAALIFFEVSTSKVGWYIFGLLAGLIIAHAVIEIIYEFDFKACFQRFATLFISTGIAAVISLIYILDLFGYDTYIPELSRIESAGIAADRIHSGLEYNVAQTGDFEFNEYNYDWGWVGPTDFRLERMALTDIADVAAIARHGTEYVKQMRLYQIFGGIEEGTEEEVTLLRDKGVSIALPYGEDGYMPQYAYVYLHYRLSGGKDIYRTYPVDFNDPEVFQAYARLYATKEYKEGVFPELLRSEEELGELYFENPSPYNYAPNVDARRKELIKAYQKELYAQELEDLAEEYPIGQLTSRVYEEDGRYLDNQYYMYIYPSMTETIAILNEMGIVTEDIYSPEKVEHIEMYHYDGQSDAYATFDDPEEIKDIMDKVIYNDYYYLNSALHPAKYEDNASYNMDAYYVYEDDDKHYAYNSYYSEPYIFDGQKEIPAFVKERLEENREESVG